MYTKSLLATSLLIGASAMAQSDFGFNKLASKYSSINTAINNWGSTESVIPSATAAAEISDYVINAATVTNAAVPAFVTALPSSLENGASSEYHDIANTEYSVFKPLLSTLSAAGIPASSVLVQQLAATATSGAPSNSANGTSSGSPTSPSHGPSATQTHSGAGKNGVMVAAGALAVGLSGVLALL